MARKLSVNEPIRLAREVLVTRIPSGEKILLAEGEGVEIKQALGGSVTVSTANGDLVRIEPADADAIGEEVPETPEVVYTEGPFDLDRVHEELRSVFDPEIPVNVTELGLIYRCEGIELDRGHRVEIDMSMTAPGCGMGDILREDVRSRVAALPGVAEVVVELVWDPPWDHSRMSDAAKLHLGLL